MRNLKKKLSKLSKSASKAAKKLLGKLKAKASAAVQSKKVRLAASAAVVVLLLAVAVVKTVQDARSSARKGFADGCVIGAAASLASIFGPQPIVQREELFRETCEALSKDNESGKLQKELDGDGE